MNPIIFLLFSTFFIGISSDAQIESHVCRRKCDFGSICVKSSSEIDSERCIYVEKIACNGVDDDECPLELPICFSHRHVCGATKDTFITCENVAKLEIHSSEPVGVGYSKLAYKAAFLNKLDLILKAPVSQTFKARQIFKNKAAKEILFISNLQQSLQR
jgi:hypothetical protein